MQTGDQTVANADATSADSSAREKVLEPLFVGELLRWAYYATTELKAVA